MKVLANGPSAVALSYIPMHRIRRGNGLRSDFFQLERPSSKYAARQNIILDGIFPDAQLLVSTILIFELVFHFRITPFFHHSNTSPLHYSITPFPFHSFTFSSPKLSRATSRSLVNRAAAAPSIAR